MDTMETTLPAWPALRRTLQAGFVFFFAKGCAWLLLAAWLGELL